MQKRSTPFNEIEFETTVAHVQPWNEGVPHINGPSVYGASPQRDFLYLIPTTGEHPLRFTADSLPSGLSLDSAKGIIAGKVENVGTYDVELMVENHLGKDSRKLRLVVCEHALAQTPPMGWNSWNCFRREINQKQITEVADAMVSSGFAAHGYSFVNLDSGWQSKSRGGQFNSIVPAETFPDMGLLCSHIHSLALKAGIYSSPYVSPWGTDGLGTTDGLPDTSFPFSYNKFVGMNRHETEDARQWAAWGFDYLKYDWVVTDMVNAAKMHDALDSTGRDILFSLVTEVALKDAQRASELANLYRANADTAPCWESIRKNGFGNGDWNPHIGPGHWLDLDMLATTPRGGKQLNRNELLSHISCWMMRPSPILLDCDPRNLDGYLMDLLCNDEIIAVNQDALGKPAATIFSDKTWDIQLKPLADGNCAVAFFNLGDMPSVAPDLPLTHWVGKGFKVRDLWARQDLEDVGDDFIVGVAPHSAKVYKIFVN